MVTRRRPWPRPSCGGRLPGRAHIENKLIWLPGLAGLEAPYQNDLRVLPLGGLHIRMTRQLLVDTALSSAWLWCMHPARAQR